MILTTSTMYRSQMVQQKKKLGGAFSGFRNNILIPKFMYGVVKSTASARCELMVKSAIAKSAV